MALNTWGLGSQGLLESSARVGKVGKWTVLRRPNFEAPKAHFLFEKNGGGKRLYIPNNNWVVAT